MRNAILPTIDDGDMFEKIIQAKKNPTNTRLARCKSKVVSSYSSYPSNVAASRSPTPLSLTILSKDALIHAYEMLTKPRIELGRKLSQSIPRCLLCSVNEASTLDHYFPKELYPEFSVLSKNLVPSCALCNNIKGTKLSTGANARLFVHPYYDILPNTSWLRAGVTIVSNKLNVLFTIHHPGNSPIHDRLARHFSELRLDARYARMARDRLRGRLHAFRILYGPKRDAALVAKRLREDSESFAAADGINDWEAVLYSALSKCDPFCDGGFDVMSP
jgi:5-methylcytosine-specific restriction endonuclease McrA